MEAEAFIDLALKFVDGVATTDADYAGRRERVLQFLQEVVDEVWMFRDWPWTYKSDTVSCTSGVGSLPTDFMEFGLQGRAYNSSTGRAMEEVPFQYLLEVRESLSSGATVSSVDTFAVFGQNTTTAARQLQLPVSAGTVSVKVWYRKVPPTISDTDADSKLSLIPAAYHNGVLLPAVGHKLRMSKGDPRDDLWRQYRDGLGRMVAQERARKTAVQRWPRTVSNW